MDLSTQYMGLSLRNPLIVSSSGITQSVDGVVRCADAGAGAVVLKSVFEESIRAEAQNVIDNSMFPQRLSRRAGVRRALQPGRCVCLLPQVDP